LDSNRYPILKQIIDNHPSWYLDEIQAALLLRNGGKRFAPSLIWKKMKIELGYSLQVATIQARQQEEEELEAYLDRLHNVVYDPELLVFLDESAKDRNSSRRRRHWSNKWQKTPIHQSLAFFGDNER